MAHSFPTTRPFRSDGAGVRRAQRSWRAPAVFSRRSHHSVRPDAGLCAPGRSVTLPQFSWKYRADTLSARYDPAVSDTAAGLLPVRLAELALEDLARILARQRRGHLDAARQLVFGDARQQESLHVGRRRRGGRTEEQTSGPPSLMRISYAGF